MSATLASVFFVLLLGCSFLCLYRLGKGPTAPDRTVAIDTLGTLVVGCCGLFALRSGSSFYMNIATAWALLRDARSRNSRGTVTSRVPPVTATVIRSFAPIRSSFTARSALRTSQVSGVTVPETTLSPSPQLAVTTTSSLFPDIGLALKITAEVSAVTSCCTNTASFTSSVSSPCCLR